MTLSRNTEAAHGGYDNVILTLWRQKLDTLDIARKLNLPESAVANRLLHVREIDSWSKPA